MAAFTNSHQENGNNGKENGNKSNPVTTSRSIDPVIDATQLLMKKFTEPMYTIDDKQLSLVEILKNMISEYNQISNLYHSIYSLRPNYSLATVVRDVNIKTKNLEQTYENLIKKSATNLYEYVTKLINFIKKARTTQTLFYPKCMAVKFINEFIKKKVMSLESIKKSANKRRLNPFYSDKIIPISRTDLDTFTEGISIQDIYAEKCYSKSELRTIRNENNANITEATINMKNFDNTVRNIKSLEFTKENIPDSVSKEYNELLDTIKKIQKEFGVTGGKKTRKKKRKTNKRKKPLKRRKSKRNTKKK